MDALKHMAYVPEPEETQSQLPNFPLLEANPNDIEHSSFDIHTEHSISR